MNSAAAICWWAVGHYGEKVVYRGAPSSAGGSGSSPSGSTGGSSPTDCQSTGAGPALGSEPAAVGGVVRVPDLTRGLWHRRAGAKPHMLVRTFRRVLGEHRFDWQELRLLGCLLRRFVVP